MAKTKSEWVVRRSVEVEPYGFENEVMNRLMDDETVWIVQGALGRIPIIADTAEEAVDEYIDRHMDKAEEPDEFE